MIDAETIRQALACGKPGCACGRPGGNVHCPGHEDKTPSLSVTNGGDKMLVHCHGGCEPDRVVDALKARNLWPSRNGNGAQTSKPRIVATYDYHDPAGKLLFQVVRREPKDFRQRRPDGTGGWVWKMAGVDRVPYRLPKLLKATTVFICEGEKDCDRLAALDLVATTNPGGASEPPKPGRQDNKWRPELNQYFKGKAVCILPDNDKAGRIHGHNVAQNLYGIADVVRIVELPGLPEKGDVSDWLAAGGTVEQLLDLVDATQEWTPPADDAQDYDRQERESIQEEAQELPPDWRGPQAPKTAAIKFITGRELQSIEFKDPAWVVPGILPEGLCLLSARPKKGKTWIALGVSSAKAAGGCALGKGELRLTQGKVLYLCLEDKLRRAQKRLKIILGDAPFPKDLILAESWPRLDKGGLEALQDFLKEHDDCKMVVIDSFVKIKPPRPKNVDPYDFDMAVGGALQSLAQERQICLLLIYHNRKSEGEDPLDDVIGSTGLTGAVDAVLVLRRGRGQADATLFVTGRDVEEQELALKFHPQEGLWELLGDAAEYAKSQERQAIIKMLREHGPKTPKELSELTGKKQNSIKGLLFKMAKDHEVKSINGTYELIER